MTNYHDHCIEVDFPIKYPEPGGEQVQSDFAQEDSEKVDFIKNKPTTIAGYKITDAKIQNGVITLGDQTITPASVLQMTAEEYAALTTKDPNVLYLVTSTGFTFGGVAISAGPRAYENAAYVMKNGWNHDSYDSEPDAGDGIYGKENGSTYFNFDEMGELFYKADYDYSEDGSIQNLLDPFNGWRLPTLAEWDAVIGTTRQGSTVNGTPNAHYALIELSEVHHAANDYPVGLLLFPDGCTITGKALTYFDDENKTNGVTLSELNNYLSQGCVFLPASGRQEDNLFQGGGYEGFYLSSTYVNEQYTEGPGRMCFDGYSAPNTEGVTYHDVYHSIRLVKPSAGNSTKVYLGSIQIVG